ncbi:MAG: MurR/RpiR family transcriptional regulator [Paracoccus sp. (in: a-proteobacteria)]|jgi:DNA-binding MurR/RpiR family transcriptional regulator|uniref:MurR/RpiR family transcriptional regulator n=2 Tax=Paracoccus TaxID=265 RepID=UPI000C5A28C2|nr:MULTISPECIES: MurR/RpiR family transcriptional regulator [unclassified Paracoccus (in: a-proteobacteria)]MAN56157.1 RpiR family transcriptional regulator [Paracoccus sp. (in: a-proteobacteria)]MBA49614.1 RpiR family transcriptional regulator [Paracoccus sp. (in: a-proteobacteria)]MCS5601516.1 MurR/RpiR family transcriptional regulator [Paracoccus sp. (in: a-proteobacteria)]|tara:strand:- start:7336 stop:8217 length:882 start_codon:yes stop_codon:yes gene_type:complete
MIETDTTDPTDATFSQRILAVGSRLSAVEARVIDWLSRNREHGLRASAAEIATAAKTSDATVIRTARKLGYGGLAELRRALAEDLRRDLTLADRMANELARPARAAGLESSAQAFRDALEAIETMAPALVSDFVMTMRSARRIHVFGIGPSGFIAGYFAAQLVRLGFDARAILRTGLQLADDLIGIGPGDAVIALAYDRPYPEVRALFDRASGLKLRSVLVTSMGPHIPDLRAGILVRVPRGRTGGFGLHAGTLALLEGLLIALSASEPEKTRSALQRLNAARQALAGSAMGL